jgi:murein DD-endopeptidase MepM/ murein hydrolase activator NlpD
VGFVLVDPAAPMADGTFRWPLDGPPHVVRRFDPPPSPWLAGHRGVDLAAAPGSAVLAAGAGTVHFAGRVAGRGVVSVNHPNGLRTTYEPLEPSVRAGQVVAPGDPVGTLAPGHGDCPAACLHWGLRRGEEYLDPLALLGLGRVRLLPLVASPSASDGVSVTVERVAGVGS